MPNKRYPGQADLQVFHVARRGTRLTGLQRVSLERFVARVKRCSTYQIIGNPPTHPGDRFILEHSVHGECFSDLEKRLAKWTGSNSARIALEASVGREARPDCCPKLLAGERCAACEAANEDIRQGRRPQRRYRIDLDSRGG